MTATPPAATGPAGRHGPEGGTEHASARALDYPQTPATALAAAATVSERAIDHDQQLDTIRRHKRGLAGNRTGEDSTRPVEDGAVARAAAASQPAGSHAARHPRAASSRRSNSLDAEAGEPCGHTRLHVPATDRLP